MKIILLERIESLGDVGAEVVVKSGYARNFLIPQSKAMLFTKRNFEIFKKKQFALEIERAKKQKKAKLCEKAINDIKSITITARSSIEGKLFGSVGAQMIAKSITEVIGFKILKSQIRLPNHEILKSIGVYKIRVHIYDQVFSDLDIIIVNDLSK